MSGINLDRIDQLVNENKFYEASQLILSFHRRLVLQKKNEEARVLLVRGIETLYQKDEPAAAQLALLLLTHTKVLPVDVMIETIDQACITLSAGSPNSSKLKFLREAIKWIIEVIKKAPESVVGQKTLSRWRTILGQQQIAAGSPHSALKSFIDAQNPSDAWNLVLLWYQNGSQDELDLFISKITLCFVEAENLRDANVYFEMATRAMYKSKEEWPPLVNFTYFVLQTLERDALPLFIKLRRIYQSSISRDPELNDILQHIAEVFFDFRSPQSAQAPNLGSIFSQLMGSFMNPQAASGSSSSAENAIDVD